jgi:hypothetical protein
LHLAGPRTEAALMAKLDVDGADVDALGDWLRDPDRWPILRIPLDQGGCLALVYCNFPDDAGVNLERVSADGAHAWLATQHDEPMSRILSWDEVMDIATRVPRRRGVVLPVARLLLLIPFLTESPKDGAAQIRSRIRPRTPLARQLTDIACTVLPGPAQWEEVYYTRLWPR